MHSADYWIKHLHLQPHPEGGYFRETYRSDEQITGLPSRFSGPRSFSTAIYFLLEGPHFSALHRIKSDEVWHFYAGTAVIIYVINPQGILSVIRLGNNPDKGDVLQAVVKRGDWFGAMTVEATSYSLMGCTVAPGFDFADFEMGKKEELQGMFPQHTDTIVKLTRE